MRGRPRQRQGKGNPVAGGRVMSKCTQKAAVTLLEFGVLAKIDVNDGPEESGNIAGTAIQRNETFLAIGDRDMGSNQPFKLHPR